MTSDLFAVSAAASLNALDTATRFEAHLATLRRRIVDTAVLADQAHAAYLACTLNEHDPERVALDRDRRWHIAVYRTWVRALLDFTGDTDETVHQVSLAKLRDWDLAA